MFASPTASLDPASTVLSFEDVSLRLGAREVLSRVSFVVAPGEVVGLLGANGSGKSTALRVACGLARPDTGRVRVGRAGAAATSVAARAAFGAIFQSPSVDPVLTVRENLRFAAMSLGMRAAEREPAVERALAKARLQDRADERVRTLSGGQRRRVDLARVLLRPTELIVLDEPSTGLDESSFRSLWADLLELRSAEGVALVVATHRPDEAERCDRLVVLREGKVVRQATPAELTAELDEDRIVVETGDARIALEQVLGAAPGWRAHVGDAGALELRGPRGTDVLPRIVASVGAERIRSVALHRPSLADAFERLTGASEGEGGQA